MFNWSSHLSKRTHRGLRHWVFYLLQDSPKNGVEIMDALESMSRGWWRPSPGSVYPLLDSMAREGVIKKLPDNKYELTQAGKEEIDWPRQFPGSGPRSIQEVLEQMSGYVSYLEDLSRTQAPKVKESSEKIRELRDRLDRLGGS
ncbi:MAG TPA: PadR family transcriptional regulator [Nitrososphaerales archaeon]|nr:PadR family transcriptional regulator [Nitrososphaerales archaeon]